MNFEFWFKDREWLNPFYNWYSYKMAPQVWAIFVRVSALTAMMFLIARENSRLQQSANPIAVRYIEFLEIMFFVGLWACTIQIVLCCMAKAYEQFKLTVPNPIASAISFTVGLLMTIALGNILLPWVAKVYIAITITGQ